MRDDEELGRGFVRLEMMLTQLGNNIERRIIPIEGSVRTLSNELHALKQKQTALEGRVGVAHETALGAMRKSTDSVTELQTIARSLVNHIERAESGRAEASKAHAKRFESHGEALKRQGEAITALQKSVTHRGHTATVLMVVSMVLIPAVTTAAIAVIQEWKAPAPQAAEVKR